MREILDAYIDEGYVYRFMNGPRFVRTKQEAKIRGINCISLAHFVLKDLFNIELPAELDCYELYTERALFEEVAAEQMATGDLLWFGWSNPKIPIENFVPKYSGSNLANYQDRAVTHVGIYTGEQDEVNDPQILHSSPVEGTNAIWPLRRFSDYPRYSKLYGITRLKNQ
jgi:cell wall-associated NlpC family hydrolase